MSDTQSTTSVKRPAEAKTMVKMKAFGDAKFLLAKEAERLGVQAENVSRVIVGRILGVATRVSKTAFTDPRTGEVDDLTALVGSFKAIPADITRNITMSAKLGLPEHIIAAVVDILSAEDAPQSVTVAWDIIAERANNPQGYSWAAIPLMGEDENDPLALLEARLAGKSETKSIEPPKGDAPATGPEGQAPTENKVIAHVVKRK